MELDLQVTQETEEALRLQKIVCRVLTVSRRRRAEVSHCELSKLAHCDGVLIPGIPDEITLNKICTKLTWRDISKLLAVSRGWFRAVRSRQVYDSRVRSDSREELQVCDGRQTGIALVSNIYRPENQGLWYSTMSDLPPIRSQFSHKNIIGPGPACRSVTFDGKVYVFGGTDRKVYVLDVAGHGQWEQCARVHRRREVYGCGVIDGKIYIFGGAVSQESRLEHEVYNDQKNTWSKVRPLLQLLHDEPVKQAPYEFLVGGERLLYRQNYARQIYLGFNFLYTHSGRLMEVYDPIQNDWRVVQPVGGRKERMFVGGEFFYSMSPRGIHVYDFHRHSWTHVHSFSFAGVREIDDSVHLYPLGILTVEREILAVVEWPGLQRYCLVQSSGLGNQNEELVWRKAECAFPYVYGPDPPVETKRSILL